MLISTKGRYALRVMVDLGEHHDGSFIPLKTISQRQEISQKYMESIMTTLSKAHLVDGQHGKNGGYRLCKAPAQYSVGEILRTIEGSLAPVACLDCTSTACSRSATCKTLPMWKELDKQISEFFDSRSLADLMHHDGGGDYVI